MELQIYQIFLAWLVTSARESSRYSQSLLGFFQRKALAFLGAHKWERQRGEEGCDYRFLYLRWGWPAGSISSMLTICIQHMTLRKIMRELGLVRQIICTSNLPMLMAGILKDVTMIQRGSTYIMSIENGVLGLHKR